MRKRDIAKILRAAAKTALRRKIIVLNAHRRKENVLQTQ